MPVETKEFIQAEDSLIAEMSDAASQSGTAICSSMEEMIKPIFACHRGKSFVIESDECVYDKMLKERISSTIEILHMEIYICLLYTSPSPRDRG